MRHGVGIGALICVFALSGCSACHPLRGIPARKLPYEDRLPQRSGQTMIDLSQLRQTPPAAHLVDTGDVLGIYIEGILGRDSDVPPIYLPQDRSIAPSVGFPIAVNPDGTISIPSMKPWYVRGMTISEVEQLIRRECTQGPDALLQSGRDRILVSLQRPRMYSVLVIRQEASNPLGGVAQSDGPKEDSRKRGTGQRILLPAYKNDVLTALAETGGLPGLDAQNAIYVIRSHRPGPSNYSTVPGASASGLTIRGQSPSSWSTVRQLQSNNYRALDSNQITSGGRAQEQLDPYPPQRMWPQAENDVNQPAHEWRPIDQQAVRLTSGIENPPPISNSPSNLPPQYPSSLAPQYPSNLPPQYPSNLQPRHEEDLHQQELGWIASSLDRPTTIRIPLRQYPDENTCIGRENVILQDGDIVFVESRELEFFYTGGLLGGGQYTLPRDYDINVLDAISIAESKGKSYLGNARAVGGISALNHDVTVGASKLIISRKQCDGSLLNIEVDLFEAMRDPAQQILIRPEDRLYLRYTRAQAVLAFFERHFLEGFLIGAASRTLYR